MLHVSGDFPDTIEPAKTPVVRRLLDLTADRFEHQVVSINRVSPGATQTVRSLVDPGDLSVMTEAFEYGTALTYVAAARGIRHETKLRQLGRWLAVFITRMERRPDLIVGHKLTIEGVAVQEAARLLRLPYAVSIQSNSDAKILDVRRDLAGKFRDVLDSAGYAFPFSPWGWTRLIGRVGRPGCPHALLPCPTDLDEPVAPRVTGGGLVSVFHLHGYRHKNFGVLAKAMKRLGPEDAPRLDVIGGGSAEDLEVCQRIARAAPTIRLLGARDRQGVRAAMNGASAFVLPSRRETFGLVFIEALFAGTPIIYPAGTAVDGLFDDMPFARRVSKNDPREIAATIRFVMQNETSLKRELEAWQTSEHAQMFKRERIAETFSRGLLSAMGARSA